MTQNFEFKDLKPKRSLWKDICSFMVLTLGIWGVSHVALNYSAFGQIIEFKYRNIKTQVFNNIDSSQFMARVFAPSVTEVALEKVEGGKSRGVSKKSKKTPKKVFEQMQIYPSDNRLYIPRIDKNVPLVKVPDHRNWQQLESNIQKGLQNGVVVHPVSHAPSSFGNFFVTGHSSYYAWDNGRFKDVFALLHEVALEDIIEIYWEGKKYVYQINEKKVVAPTAIEVLNQPKDEQILTLMTCTPVGTNKNRLILVADLLN